MVIRRFIVVMLGVLFLPSSLLAAVLPSARDVQVDPGQSAQVVIPIENTSAMSENVQISLMSAKFVDGQDQPMLEKMHADVASWMSISQSSMTLISGEKESTTLTIAPPATTQNQTMTVAVVVTESTPGQIVLNHGSATLVFVTIGEEKAIGRCVDFASSTMTSANVTMTNEGRGILVADGSVVLRGPFGLRLAQVALNPSSHRVLSGQTRSWSIDVPTVPWWAFGPLSWKIEDQNVTIDACGPLSAGSRWWPVVMIVAMIGMSTGSTVWFGRMRQRKS